MWQSETADKIQRISSWREHISVQYRCGQVQKTRILTIKVIDGVKPLKRYQCYSKKE